MSYNDSVVSKLPKLCPACRHTFLKETVSDDGDMVYVHAEYEMDEQTHFICCLITDQSEIRGVRMGPDMARR